MALLTPSDFITKWRGRFADNTTGAIDEGALREFAQDLSDSALDPKLNKGVYSIIDRDLWAFGRRVLSVFSHGMLEINHRADFEQGVRIYGPVYIDDLRTTPPAPDGVSFTMAPGAPTITNTAITETSSVVDNEGVVVNVPGQTLNFALAAAGKHRYDAIVVNYGVAPGYERISGTEVLASSAAPTPSIPEDRLFVRFIEVTDGQAAPTGSQPSRDFTVSFTSPNREFLDFFDSATAIKAIKLRSGVDSFSYSVDGGATYITPVLPITSVINIPAGTEIRYRITYAAGSTLGAVYFQLS